MSKPGDYSTKPIVCYRCGGNHLAPQCSFIDAICRACKKKGHIAKVCCSKHSQPTQHTRARKSATAHRIDTSTPPPELPSSPTNDNAYTMFPVNSRSRPIVLPVKLDNKEIQMELDTGASLSVIGKETYRLIFGKDRQPDPTLHQYNGQDLPVVGAVDVHVYYEGQTATLPLVVVKGQGASLFGRNWLEQIRVNWSLINSIQQKPNLNQLIDRHGSLFSDEIGSLKGTTAKIFVPPDARPRFFKPRRLPYSLKEKVERELDRLQGEGIIEPVRFAEWAAPMVPVVKANGQIRVYGDYRVTVKLLNLICTRYLV